MRPRHARWRRRWTGRETGVVSALEPAVLRPDGGRLRRARGRCARVARHRLDAEWLAEPADRAQGCGSCVARPAAAWRTCAIVPGLDRGIWERRDGGAAERALNQLLVEMVTINPATTVRWDDQVGSIEIGKAADLLVIEARSAPQKPRGHSTVAVPTIDRCHRAGCRARDGRRHRASRRRRGRCRRSSRVTSKSSAVRPAVSTRRLIVTDAVDSHRERNASRHLGSPRRRVAGARWRSTARWRRTILAVCQHMELSEGTHPGRERPSGPHVQFRSRVLLWDDVRWTSQPRSDDAAATLHRRRSLVVRDAGLGARCRHRFDRGFRATVRAVRVKRESGHAVRESVCRAAVSRPLVRRSLRNTLSGDRTHGLVSQWTNQKRSR